MLGLLCFFCLLVSTASAASAVLGVDLGTEYIKAALVKPGIPLEIVLTKDSRRKEAATVAFKPPKDISSGGFPERVYGSDAVALAARFPADTYPNLKRLLGLPAENAVVEEYASRYPALQLVSDRVRHTAAFKSSSFVAGEEPWTVEEILAMELQSIQKNAEALAGAGSVIKDIVITVPVFYSLEEKRAIQLAAELAGLRVLSLLSDGLAVGLNYATTRTFPTIAEGVNPEYHMIFDMGAGSTKASVVRFQGRVVKDVGKLNKTIQEVQVMGSGWDRTLGGDAMNAAIVEDMVATFVATPAAKKVGSTVEAVKGHGRAVAKLWKEAERLRQVLSANTVAQTSFEGLYDDVDFKYKITRADFEGMVKSTPERVAATIQKALEAADLDIKDLDSVILHGGAIRTPFVQKQLETIIGDTEKVRSNVNGDEAAVFGAAFKGAGLSPSFRVKEIRGSEAATYAIGVKWTNIYEKPQHQRLWQPKSLVGGAEKTVTFKNQDDFSIGFYQHVPSSENVSPGSAEKEIFLLTTKNLTASVAQLKEKFACTDGDIDFKVSARLSPADGKVDITKAVLTCDVDDDKKGGVVDGVKGLFGFGSKKTEQEILSDDVPFETDDSTSTSTTATTSSAASASANAKEPKAKAKRTEIINIDYTFAPQGMPAVPADELKRMTTRLAAFTASDTSRRLREEALNQLEAFTYRARDVLSDESFIAASTKAERATLEAQSEGASEWLYGEGAEANIQELQDRLMELRDIVAPIEKRREEAERRPELVKTLKEALEQAGGFIETVKDEIAKAEASAVSVASEATASIAGSSSSAPASSSAPDDDFADLEDEDYSNEYLSTSSKTSSSAKQAAATATPPTYTIDDLTEITKLYDSVSAWLATKLAAQDALAATADPVLLGREMAEKASQLNKVGMELMMKAVRGSSKPRAGKSEKAKTKAKGAKEKSGKKGKKVKGEANDGKGNGPKIFKVGEGGEMPSEEEILEAIKMQEGAHDEL